MYNQFIMQFYNPNLMEFQFQNGIFGIDGISQWQIQLVNIFMPIQIQSSPAEKMQITLQILTGFWSIAVFLVTDIQQFYICFEGVLIPIYQLITNYGSRGNKIKASYEFFIYTQFGSQFQFVSILFIYLEIGTTDYLVVSNHAQTISANYQIIQWQGFFQCFAVKIPVFGLHIWLLKAHVEANSQTSAIQAAILQKLGSFGQIRYSLTLFPIGTNYFRSFLITLSIIGIIYTSISAFIQNDFLRRSISFVGH